MLSSTALLISCFLTFSCFATPVQPSGQLPLSSHASAYPHHDLHLMNDGNICPSPAFGVGSALYNQNATDAVLSALKVGYRHLDNAATYGNEESVGAAIKAWGGDRKELYVTSKWDKLQGRDPRTELMESLRLLGLEYLDLYLIHFPHIAVDNQTEVWQEFEAFKEEGLVRSIGVSNFAPDTLLPLLATANIPPAINQIRYHVYNAPAQQSTLDLCAAHNILVETYGALEPLKHPGGAGEGAAEEAARALSGRSGREVNGGQAILDWVRSKGLVAVTTSNKPWRQEQNLEVFDESFPTLTSEEIEAFERSGSE